MGYCTYHTLSFEVDSKKKEAQITNDFRNIVGQHVFDCVEVNGVGDSYEIKWYECVGEMKELSSKYPDVLFVVNGEGEESGDIWREYHKNGKVQRCKAKISFDNYDEEKLK